MNINDFSMKLKEVNNWNRDKVSLKIPNDTLASKRLKFTYPLLDEGLEKTFKLTGNFGGFNDAELYSIVYLIAFFMNFSEDIEVYNTGDSIRFEVLVKGKNNKDKLILQYAYTENEHYKYVQLTSIVLPPFMKYNRLSLMIIGLLYLSAKDYHYDMWVVQIVNERWMKTLINHGGVSGLATSDDIQVKSDFWIFKDDVDRANYRLNFNI